MKAIIAGRFAALIALAMPATHTLACDEHAKGAAHACEHATTGAATAGDASAKGERLVVPVNGMHCSRCAERVTAAVAKVKGVKWVETNLDTRRTVVVVDRAAPAGKAIVAAIKDLGYEPGTPAAN
jgi:copper chaperone CopZ